MEVIEERGVQLQYLSARRMSRLQGFLPGRTVPDRHRSHWRASFFEIVFDVLFGPTALLEIEAAKRIK